MIRLALVFALLLTPAICFAQTVTSSGPVTIVANDDGTGDDGTIEFKNGAATRLFVNDDGTIYILKKLGINTSTPSALLHLSPTYPANTTASQRMIMFTPPGPQPESFVFYQRSTLQGDDPTTHSVGWGFNPDSEETGPDGKPAGIQFQMENTFGHGDTANFEVHLEVRPWGTFPQAFRPWTWNINRKTGAAEVATTAKSSFQDGLNLFQISAAELLAIGPARHVGNVAFETPLNQGALAKQIRIVPLPSDATQTAVSFGGLAYLANSGATLHVYNSDGTPGKLGAGRVIVGKTGFDSSLGVRVGSGQSIRFSTSSDPFGSADATIARNGPNSLNVYNPDGNAATTINGSFNAVTQNGGSFKANGIKVVGAQCAAIPNSNGTQADNTRAINALLACMRSHGLVAQEPPGTPAATNHNGSLPMPTKRSNTRILPANSRRPR